MCRFTYRHALSTDLDRILQVPEPPEWRHADLEQLKDFIRARISEGSYYPAFPEGLSDD